MLINYLDCTCDSFSGGVSVYLCTTYAFRRSATLCHAFSLCFIAVAVFPFFFIWSLTSSCASISISCSDGEKYAALVAMVNQWIFDRSRGLFDEAVCAHWSRIGFTWLDESVSAHPGLVFVQPIKPGRSCFGFVEPSLVIYPGCLNPTFVQRAPGRLSGLVLSSTPLKPGPASRVVYVTRSCLFLLICPLFFLSLVTRCWSSWPVTGH